MGLSVYLACRWRILGMAGCPLIYEDGSKMICHGNANFSAQTDAFLTEINVLHLLPKNTATFDRLREINGSHFSDKGHLKSASYVGTITIFNASCRLSSLCRSYMFICGKYQLLAEQIRLFQMTKC